MATSVREIAVDERNAVLVDENGAATLIGKGAAYFILPTQKPEICQPGKPAHVSQYRRLQDRPFGEVRRENVDWFRRHKLRPVRGRR